MIRKFFKNYWFYAQRTWENYLLYLFLLLMVVFGNGVTFFFRALFGLAIFVIVPVLLMCEAEIRKIGIEKLTCKRDTEK